MDNATPTPTPHINITSQNQSGGFTGYNSGIVNLKDPPWGLLVTPTGKNEMIALLKTPKKRDVALNVAANNGESEFMANNVAALLTDAEITFKPAFCFWSPLVRGIQIQLEPNDAEAKELGEAIRQALRLGGIEATMLIQGGSNEPVMVNVGIRP